MAMYVCAGTGKEKFTYVCHVGGNDRTTLKTILEQYPDGFFEAQADGHELEKIKNDFPNIPHCDNRVVHWYGDIARFIVGNWK